MKQRIWQSKHFKKIFRTVHLTTFALLVSTLVMTYFSFQKVTGSYLDSAMSRFIETAYSTVDHQISNSQKNALNVSMTPSAAALFSQETLSTVDRYTAMHNVDYFISQDSCIHSVLFYNNTTDEVFMFGRDLSSGQLKDFYDRDIVNQIYSPGIPLIQFMPRVIQNSRHSDTSSTVLTTFYHLGGGNYVITNLDTENLFSVLHNDPAVYSNASTNYLVYHNKNNMVYDSFYHEELDNSDEKILKALNDHQWQESFAASINGIHYRFHVLDDPEYNLQMVSIIRQSDISASLLTYLIPSIAIIIFIGLISLIVNLRVSSKLYSPIEQIRRTLPAEEPGAAPSKDTGDEVDYITHRITDVSSRLNALFSYRQKSLSLSQEIFLKDQLLYNKYSDDEFWDKCIQEELPYRDGDAFVLVYTQWCPMTGSAINNTVDQGLLCFALGNVVHELFGEDVNVRDLPFEKDGIAFLFCFQGNALPSISNSVLKNIQSTFSQYFDLSISFFISDPFSKPRHLTRTMQRLQELSDYRFFYDEGCILHTNDIPLEQLHTDICPVADIDLLESSIRTTDWGACQQLLDVYFSELPKYTKEAASASINVFASKLITCLKKIESTYPAFPGVNYHQLYADLAAASTLGRTKELIYTQLEGIIESLKSIDSNSMGIDAKDVQHYLESIYQDFSISSKSVAQHFHVSVPYLNRIFKQKTGESISFYIKKLRLEHARQLLLTTTHPVEVIAKTVGFENTKYFYSMFKNEYGVSPSTYRTSNKNAGESEAPEAQQ